MTLAPQILTTSPSKQQKKQTTTTTSTTFNYKNRNDAMKLWISLCHLCKVSRRNQCEGLAACVLKAVNGPACSRMAGSCRMGTLYPAFPAKSWTSPARCAGQVPVLCSGWRIIICLSFMRPPGLRSQVPRVDPWELKWGLPGFVFPTGCCQRPACHSRFP